MTIIFGKTQSNSILGGLNISDFIQKSPIIKVYSSSIFPLIQYVCGLGVFYKIQCLLLLLGLHKKTVAPGTGGLEEHLKNPGSTDLF